MELVIERSVVVITPTIGSPKLKDAIASVQSQTYKNIKHLLVVDGADHYDAAFNVMLPLPKDNIEMLILPYNTGKTGGNFYGHRIYAAIPHLINADYVFFLDEDNWYESDHVASLVKVLEQGNDFAYSLRQIYEPDKTYVCHDNCEALGKWPIFLTHPVFQENYSNSKTEEQYLIDTSSFAFRRDFLQKTCHHWHSGWGGDRKYFYSVLAGNPNYDTNYKHSLCYRLDGNPGSVGREFFIKGNEAQLENYNGVLPWLKT
jgi:glycosyltransferase involved in cell wall biosynthesis